MGGRWHRKTHRGFNRSLLYEFNKGVIHSVTRFLQVSLSNPLDSQDAFQEDLWFDLFEESLCNWMMFVRPAQNHLEQNLVAYQYGQHIYYTTIKNIEPKQELRVLVITTHNCIMLNMFFITF